MDLACTAQVFLPNMNKQNLHLEIFTDFVCPWCYLATAVVARLQQQYPDLKVTWLPFPLHPSTPPEGMLLSEMLPGVNLEAAHRRLYALMDELGLEHGQRNHTYNSRLAQELAMWAETRAGGAALTALLYRAYFVDNSNLADPAILLALVNQAGLDEEQAMDVLDKRSFSAVVDASWDKAKRLRITGIPTFIAGGFQMTGFQPLEELQRFVEYTREKQKP